MIMFIKRHRPDVYPSKSGYNLGPDNPDASPDARVATRLATRVVSRLDARVASRLDT